MAKSKGKVQKTFGSLKAKSKGLGNKSQGAAPGQANKTKAQGSTKKPRNSTASGPAKAPFSKGRKTAYDTKKKTQPK